MMKFKPYVRIACSFLILFSLQGCVTKSRYQAQVTESRTLSEKLQSEQEKSAGLEKEVSDLKKRIGAMASETAKREKESDDRIAVLEQQLAVARESKNKTEQELKDEMIRMKGTSEEANQRQQALLQELKDQNEALKNTLALTEEEAAKRERELREATKTREDLIGKLQKEINDGSIKISQLKNKLSVEIVDKILFPSGSDQITGEGKGVLKKVSDILKDVKENNIRIEGHTDNVPIGSKLKEKFPSNWELSTSRATQVVRFLSDQGIDPEKLHAVGLSEYHPVTSNDTLEGKQRNRRIEIILFPKDIQEIAAEAGAADVQAD